MNVRNVFLSVLDGTFCGKMRSRFFFATYHLYAVVFLKNVRIKRNKIVLANFYGRGYGCNPKYIAEYILRNNLDYELVWIVDKAKCRFGDDLPDGIRKVRYKSYKSVKELASAGFWIDNCRKDYFPPKKQGQVYIQTWHGTFRTKKIEADAVLPDIYVKMAKRDSSAIDYLLSGCKKRTAQFRQCFWYDGAIVETGCPRNDILFDESSGAIIKKKIREMYGLDFKSKILLYVPTFRNSHTLDFYDVDYAAVRSALEERFGGEWHVMVRLHPGMLPYAEGLRLPDFVLNGTFYNDIQELLCASDAVLTDYSSMGDYSLYLKPLFRYCPDLDSYKAERGFYEDIESLPFPIAHDNVELVRTILDFDAEKYETKLLDYYTENGLFGRGHASKNVVALIEQGLSNG